MAHTTHQSQTGFSAYGLVTRVVTAIYNAHIKLAEAQSRVQKIKYLQALSDEELSKRGLTRDRIVQSVFADTLWL